MAKLQIHHGFYNAFYAFKLFESNGTNEQYVKIINNLKETGIIISAETIEKEINHMESFSNYLVERKKEYRSLENEQKAIPAYLARSISKTHDKPSIIFSMSEESIDLILEDNLTDELEVSQTNALNRLVSLYSAEEQYTGFGSKTYKNRFLLLPPQLSIKHENYFHPEISLTLFKHGYAILNLTMEIENMAYEDINLSAWDLDFEKVYLPEFMINDNGSFIMKKKARCNSVNRLLGEYVNYINKQINYENTQEIGQHFFHLVLSKYTNMPEEFKEDNNDKQLNDILFKLLFSPIQDYQLKPEQEITKFINNRYFSFSKHIRLFANSNRTISAYSKNFQKSVKPFISESLDLNNTYILNHLAQNSSIGGMINAIESILLKKEATQKLSVFEVQEHTSLKKLIDLLIQENTNYAMEFSKYFYNYGSVRDLITFLEDKCEDFLQTKLMNERRERIEKVISLKKERHVANFTALGPILSIVITLILSFPALESILKTLDMEVYLFKTYVVFNLFFIIGFTYLLREQIKEVKNDVKKNYALKIKRLYWELSIKLYIISYEFAEFMNLEYKEASILGIKWMQSLVQNTRQKRLSKN